MPEPCFKCDLCGIEVSESAGEWQGDIYGSPFYCNLCLMEAGDFSLRKPFPDAHPPNIVGK